MTTVDVRAEKLSVELLGLGVETRESLLGVGNEDSTVRGTLEGTKDTRTGGSALQTNIQETLEGAGSSSPKGSTSAISPSGSVTPSYLSQDRGWSAHDERRANR